MREAQSRCARRLHDGNQAPESARGRINAVGHCAAGIRLADGAGEGINNVRARVTTTSDFEPVNGIADRLLRGCVLLVIRQNLGSAARRAEQLHLVNCAAEIACGSRNGLPETAGISRP